MTKLDHHDWPAFQVVEFLPERSDKCSRLRLSEFFGSTSADSAMNHDAQRFEIEVLDAQQSDLAGSQNMAVGEQKDRCAGTNPRPGGSPLAQIVAT
jgi:hypothetical protein